MPIELLRRRLAQTADTERSLVQELSDALKRFDQETFKNVRDVAAEHEAWRSGILNELHALAARIGTFLPAREASETPVIEQHNEPHARTNGHDRPSYHDELELNMRASDGRIVTLIDREHQLLEKLASGGNSLNSSPAAFTSAAPPMRT